MISPAHRNQYARSAWMALASSMDKIVDGIPTDMLGNKLSVMDIVIKPGSYMPLFGVVAQLDSDMIRTISLGKYSGTWFHGYSGMWIDSCRTILLPGGRHALPLPAQSAVDEVIEIIVNRIRRGAYVHHLDAFNNEALSRILREIRL